LNWFGAAYYPEHWPRERWREDARVMAYLGINVVRIGEFSWGVVEKRPGQIDFTLLDEAIEALYSEGIRIIMGTPTAAPPSWLLKKYPGVLRMDGDRRTPVAAGRRQYCFNSPRYRIETERIVSAYVDHYGKDHRIIAWQADNEYGCHGSTLCYCRNCAGAFREWLRERYGTLDNLNQSWGTVFWSHTYGDWEEINPPKPGPVSPNPSLVLDYRRFSSDSAIEYHDIHKEIIKKSSKAPLTHNLMVNFTDIDYRKLARKIDFVSWDNYVAGEYDPDLQALNHDLMRSLKKAPFLVMEQQPGRVNWRSVNNAYPSEQLAFWIKQSVAHGAFGSLVFRYRQLPFGAEQFHGGLLNYDGTMTERARVFAETIKELRNWKIEDPQKEAAIYIDYENFWIGETDNLNGNFRLLFDSILPIYKAFRNFGYNVDFLFPGESPQSYSFVAIPSAFKLDEDFVRELLKFKGKIFITAMTAQKDQNNNIRVQKADDFQLLTGIHVVDFGGLEGPIKVSSGKNVFDCDFVAEEIEVLDGCQTVARYIDGPFKGKPAVTVKGNCYYVGTIPDVESIKRIFLEASIERKAEGSARLLSMRSYRVILNPYPYSLRLKIGEEIHSLKQYEVKRI